MTPGLFTIHQDGRAKFKKKVPNGLNRPLFSEANKKVKGLSCKSARTERRASEPASCRIYAEASVESQQEEPQPHFAVSHALLCISSSGKWTSQTKHRHSEGGESPLMTLKTKTNICWQGSLHLAGVRCPPDGFTCVWSESDFLRENVSLRRSATVGAVNYTEC